MVITLMSPTGDEVRKAILEMYPHEYSTRPVVRGTKEFEAIEIIIKAMGLFNDGELRFNVHEIVIVVKWIRNPRNFLSNAVVFRA